VDAVAPSNRQILTFHAGGEEYGFDILRVREIVNCGTLTRVPNVPGCVRGVMNLRGSVIPVLDLALLFGLPATEVRRRTCIVVVEATLDGESARLGVLGDLVGEVLDIPAEEIEAPPAFGTVAGAERISGMARRENRFVLILDLDRTLELVDPAMAASALSSAGDAAAQGTAGSA